MMSIEAAWTRRQLAETLAGPMLAGAILGLRGGPLAVVVLALGLPAVVAAVTLLTAPTLYVGGVMVGLRLSLGQMVAVFGRAVHALGVAWLGLAPVGLFLAATLGGPRHHPWGQSDGILGCVIALLTVGLVVSLHRLRSELGVATRPVARELLFGAYALSSLVIGARLLMGLVDWMMAVSS